MHKYLVKPKTASLNYKFKWESFGCFFCISPLQTKFYEISGESLQVGRGGNAYNSTVFVQRSICVTERSRGVKSGHEFLPLCSGGAASAMPLLNLVLLAAPWRKMHCSQKKKRERNLFCISQPFIFPLCVDTHHNEVSSERVDLKVDMVNKEIGNFFSYEFLKKSSALTFLPIV